MSDLLNIAQQFSGLPMQSLIGGPLCAAAEANAQMAHTQSEFILKTCFNSRISKLNLTQWDYQKKEYINVVREEKLYDPISTDALSFTY